MELAGARRGHDVDLAAARAAHLGRVAAGLHLELLHRVRRRAEVLGVEGRVRIGGAVQQEVVRVRPVAADRDGGRWPGRQ